MTVRRAPPHPPRRGFVRCRAWPVPDLGDRCARKSARMKSAAAEVVIEPAVGEWVVTVHWPRGHPTRLRFSTEQAARTWVETASSDWIANHPKLRVGTARRPRR